MTFMADSRAEIWRSPEMIENAYASRADWSHATLIWEGPCSVQPDKSYESFTPARDTSQEKLKIYLPITAVVGSADRMRIDGVWFEIDGEPKRSAQTSRRHIRVAIWRAVR